MNHNNALQELQHSIYITAGLIRDGLKLSSGPADVMKCEAGRRQSLLWLQRLLQSWVPAWEGEPLGGWRGCRGRQDSPRLRS